jgi:peptidoglycan/LPS O-acetylase OafA/YrhL
MRGDAVSAVDGGSQTVRRDAAGRATIPELDGVRGLAILLVLLFHFQGVRPHLIPKALTYPMILGWSGVDLFFVLSGFLITGILVETREAENYFSSFYARRVLRILPLYLVAVFLCFRVAVPLARLGGVELDPAGGLEPWFWFHASNWPSAFGRDFRPLSHFWSLSIEEQFYLVWPVLVLWIPPRRLGAACALLAAGSCGLRCFAAFRGAPPEALHRLTVFRLDALALGGLAAWIVRSPRALAWVRLRLRRIATVAVLLVAATVAVSRGAVSAPMTSLGYTAFAVLYATLVFAAFDRAGSRSRLAGALRRPWLRSFGRYSYAMYVFHYPIALYQASLFADWARGVSEPAQAGIWVSSVVIGIGLSYAVGVASWNLIEKRFLALKRFFVARTPAVALP